MEKVLKLKGIFERKIETWNSNIQQYNDMYNEAEKENRNKSITVSKYEQNRAKMAQYERQIDRLVPELKTYMTVLEIINNVIEAED